MPAIDGIDVSTWQGDISWPTVAATLPDAAFVSIKVTGCDGAGRLYRDGRGAANLAAVRSLVDHGWHHNRRSPWRPVVIPYHFGGGADPAAQADHIAAAIGALRPGELVMVDWESAPEFGIPNYSQSTIDAVMRTIAGRVGRPPINYMGAFYPGASDPRLAAWPLWLPWYGVDRPPRSPRPWLIHQWSSTVRIAGITANTVDVNQLADPAALVALAQGDEEPMTPELASRLDKIEADLAALHELVRFQLDPRGSGVGAGVVPARDLIEETVNHARAIPIPEGR
jgi:GH25 family lysozyme M1 (1,4-beta-N-acetylmuramidase)